MVATISVTGSSGIEASNTDLAFTIRLSSAQADPVTVSYMIVSGTARDGANEDFYGRDWYSIRTVTFNPGETTKTVTAPVVHDNAVEFDEALVIQLFDPVNGEFADGAKFGQAVSWIYDNDGVGNKLSMFVTDSILTEGNSGTKVAKFIISMSQAQATDTVFTYRTIAGSASEGSDFVSKTGTFTMFAGQTEATVSIVVKGDTLDEQTEDFFLKVDAPSIIASGDIGTVGRAVIVDNDSADGPTISVEGGRVLESNSGDVPFIITLSEASTETVTVSYRLVPGTARDGANEDFYGEDYYGVRTLTFAPGEVTKQIIAPITHDNLVEPDESLVLQLVNPVNASFGGDARVLNTTGWILDNDSADNKRAVHVTDAVVTEGDNGSKLATFHISLSRESETDTEFTWKTVDGSALAGKDYRAESGTLTLAAGQTEASISIRIKSDTLVEGAESFYLDLAQPASVAGGAFGTVGKATILDNDGAAGPSISIEGSRVIESNSSDMAFHVMLSEPSSTTVTVSYRAISGTALSTGNQDFYGEDYYGTRLLTFNPGETSKVVAVPVTHDNLSEADESVVLQLVDPTNATFVGGVTTLNATGWILDNDNVGTTRSVFISSPTVEERNETGDTQASFVVSLSRAFETRTVLDYGTVDGSARAGRDYVAKSGQLVFEAGQTEAIVVVDILNDVNFEASETFALRIKPPLPAGFALGTSALEYATILDASVIGTSDAQVLRGTIFRDAIDGKGGADRIYGGASADLLAGDTGNDTLYGGSGSDRLIGGGGRDTLVGGAGDDRMEGGGGNDRYDVRDAGDEVIEGRDRGTDVVYSKIDYTLTDNVENLFLKGTAANGAGNSLDNDITGSDVDNLLEGLSGNDRMYGRSGNDTVLGGGGNDRLFGNDGNDRLDGGTGRDVMQGAEGDDTYVVDNAGDKITEGRNKGIDTVESEVDWILGDNLENLTLLEDAADGSGNGLGNVIYGNSERNTIKGKGGGDTIYGGGGSDRLQGDSGKDALYGGTGNDRIDGGAGNDLLNGGLGSDVLTGGGGSDSFVFTDAAESATGSKRDTISDFDRGNDRVDLRRFDADTTRSGTQDFDYIRDDAFSSTAGELRFKNGVLFGDVDGDGVADFSIAIGVNNLSGSDFLL